MGAMAQYIIEKLLLLGYSEKQVLEMPIQYLQLIIDNSNPENEATIDQIINDWELTQMGVTNDTK
jgi:hypothetical protein